jgi:GTPase
VAEADLILMISDCSAPGRAQQDEQVLSVLEEIGAKEKPLVRVWNKADLLTADDRQGFGNAGAAVLVSAKTGEGIDELLRVIDQRLNSDPLETVRLRFGPGERKELSLVYESGRVLSREEGSEFVTVDAKLPHSLVRRFAKHYVAAQKKVREKSPKTLLAHLQ